MLGNFSTVALSCLVSGDKRHVSKPDSSQLGVIKDEAAARPRRL